MIHAGVTIHATLRDSCHVTMTRFVTAFMPTLRDHGHAWRQSFTPRHHGHAASLFTPREQVRWHAMVTIQAT